jgi:SH3-like domain-containing protein
MRANDAKLGSGAVQVSADDIDLVASGSMLPIKDLPPVDLSLMSVYDAIRTNSKEGMYKVTNGFVNVRGAPDQASAFVGRLEEGNLVKVVEFSNAQWAKVELAPGKTGFIASRYLSRLTTEERLASDKKEFEGLYYVNFGFVNMRNQPTQQSEKIAEIPGQSLLRPISMDSEWARVKYANKEGFVSMQYMAPFLPNFIVRQDAFTVPILIFQGSDSNLVQKIPAHVQELKNAGAQILTFRKLADMLREQEQRDVRLPPRSVIVGVSGVTAQNVRQITDIFTAQSVPVTLFIESDELGITGITEKTTLTLLANGFDLQSATHTGHDLRTLSTQQVQYEVQQSRKALEDLTRQPVMALLYPQGGTNDRIADRLRAAGYLFGVGNLPQASFTRSQLLSLPSITITGAMSTEDVVTLSQVRP